METATVYDALAGLMQYPGEDYPERVRRSAEALAAVLPEAASRLAEFSRQTGELTVEAFQELYTATFDLNPVASLEVGWHLFGEAYERGAFLVKMRQALRRLDLPESAELPDHLSHVLRILPRLPAEAAGQFARGSLLPAVTKMRAGLEAKGNPFAHVLGAIAVLLEGQDGHAPEGPAVALRNGGGL